MPHILQSRNMIEMRDILFKTRNQMALITFGNDKTTVFDIPVKKQASTQKCSTVICLLQLRETVISQHLYSFNQVNEKQRGRHSLEPYTIDRNRKRKLQSLRQGNNHPGRHGDKCYMCSSTGRARIISFSTKVSVYINIKQLSNHSQNKKCFKKLTPNSLSIQEFSRKNNISLDNHQSLNHKQQMQQCIKEREGRGHGGGTLKEECTR